MEVLGFKYNSMLGKHTSPEGDPSGEILWQDACGLTLQGKHYIWTKMKQMSVK